MSSIIHAATPRLTLPLETFPQQQSQNFMVESLLALNLIVILQRDFCPRGLCYWNVAAMVREHGGEMVLGWQCLWWPGRLVIAMHHAVWRRPTGALLDVTQKDTGEQNSTTSFCEDATDSVDLQWPVLLPNKYINLQNDKNIDAVITAFQEQIEAAREAAAFVKSKRGTFVPGKGLKLPSGSMPEDIRLRIRRANFRKENALKKCLSSDSLK